MARHFFLARRRPLSYNRGKYILEDGYMYENGKIYMGLADGQRVEM